MYNNRSRYGELHLKQCERGDLNPHPRLSGLDPKSSASANSATLALPMGRRRLELRTR
jgi:hypothetical protein